MWLKRMDFINGINTNIPHYTTLCDYIHLSNFNIQVLATPNLCLMTNQEVLFIAMGNFMFSQDGFPHFFEYIAILSTLM